MKVLLISVISFLSLYLFVGATDKKVIIEDREIIPDSLYRYSGGDSTIYLKEKEYETIYTVHSNTTNNIFSSRIY